MYGLYRKSDLSFAPTAGTSGIISGAGVHQWSEQLGASRAIHIDAVSQALDLFNDAGAVPTISSRVWELGRGQWSGEAADEGLLGDFLFVLLLDYAPTTGDRQKIEGWASWTFAGDGSLLPVGHPYKSAAPTTGVSADAAIADAGDAASSASQVRIQAAAAKTEAGDALAATAAATSGLTANGSMAEASDTAVSAAALKLRATLAGADAADALSAAGVKPAAAIAAALAATEAGDTLGSAGAFFAWAPVSPTPETWTAIPPPDETWTPKATFPANWSAL